MSAKLGSRLLVIDASVAQAAGRSEHPTSKACRGWLEGILYICHRTADTPALREETGCHQSRFFIKWLASMERHGKAPRVKAFPRAAVLRAMEAAHLSEKNRKAVRKDLHLIEAALAGDGVIITLDDTLQGIIESDKELRKAASRIRWIHPVRDDVDMLRRL